MWFHNPNSSQLPSHKAMKEFYKLKSDQEGTGSRQEVKDIERNSYCDRQRADKGGRFGSHPGLHRSTTASALQQPRNEHDYALKLTLV